MWTTLASALIAATAALGGVTAGALVEPLKLGAARRARVRDDRAARCAKLIEVAMTCRARLLALDLAHRRAASGVEVDVTRGEELVESYRMARNELRQTVALLRLSGPDELVQAATGVREAERALRGARFVDDDGASFDQDRLGQRAVRIRAVAGHLGTALRDGQRLPRHSFDESFAASLVMSSAGSRSEILGWWPGAGGEGDVMLRKAR